MKVLLYILVAWLVWSLIKRKLLAPRPTAEQTHIPTETVSCAVCALHLPRPEAIAAHGVFYCCTEHQQQAASR